LVHNRLVVVVILPVADNYYY